MNDNTVLQKMDALVDAHVRRVRLLAEEMTPGRARMFVRQHRLNTRQRNSVLKLRVATNCPDWDTKLNIIKACSQEIIADHEFGHGKPHWEVLEDLGVAIGLKREDILAEKPIPSTEIAWAAWSGLMSGTHWLEGIVANTCAERTNVPGYGTGRQREVGWSGVQHDRWKQLFNLSEDQLEFWSMHSEADLEHSELGWKAVARYASDLHMEDAVVHACDINLRVWEMYMNGIAEAGDRLSN